jgi:uncharacterized protein YbjT (DUF2867 family)
VNVALFGATGMVGSGVLLECLGDARVDSVLVVGRNPCGVVDEKVREHLRTDFFDYEDMADALAGLDACFFCLGVSAYRLDEATYRRLTYDLTLAAARALEAANPGLAFCYVSGEGTDSSEKGRFMWARVKGATENALLSLLPGAYMFRPGYVQPMKGVRSKTRLYQTLYNVAAPLYPLLRRMFGGHMTTSENVGKAMIQVAARGYEERVLENRDINRVATGSTPPANGGAPSP